jgi:fucose permease
LNNNCSRSRLTTACCFGFLACGMLTSLVGVTLEVFARRLDAGVTEIGGIFFFTTGIAAFIMLFAAGPLIDRFGKKPVLVAGSLFTGTSMLLIGRAGSLGEASAVMFLLGAGSGIISGGVNTLLNDDLYPVNPGRALNLVNVFFGIGAVTVPFFAGWFLQRLELETILRAISAFCFLPGLLFLASPFPAPREGARFRWSESGKALSDPLVGRMALVLFFYVGLESSLGTWSRPALLSRWPLDPSRAQMVLGGYWAALVLGRALAGTVLHGVSGHRLVLCCTAGACAGLAGFVLAPAPAVAAAGLWLCGLCFAPIFPSSLGTAGICFKHYTGTIFSLMIAAGVLGQVALTPAIGRIAKAVSFERGMWLALIAGLLMLGMQIAVSLAVTRRLRQNADN